MTDRVLIEIDGVPQDCAIIDDPHSVSVGDLVADARRHGAVQDRDPQDTDPEKTVDWTPRVRVTVFLREDRPVTVKHPPEPSGPLDYICIYQTRPTGGWWDRVDEGPAAYFRATPVRKAAPELLEALKIAHETMMSLFRSGCPSGNYGEGQNRFADSDPGVQAVRAAIAEAEGEEDE